MSRTVEGRRYQSDTSGSRADSAWENVDGPGLGEEGAMCMRELLVPRPSVTKKRDAL